MASRSPAEVVSALHGSGHEEYEVGWDLTRPNIQAGKSCEGAAEKEETDGGHRETRETDRKDGTFHRCAVSLQYLVLGFYAKLSRKALLGHGKAALPAHRFRCFRLDGECHSITHCSRYLRRPVQSSPHCTLTSEDKLSGQVRIGGYAHEQPRRLCRPLPAVRLPHISIERRRNAPTLEDPTCIMRTLGKVDS